MCLIHVKYIEIKNNERMQRTPHPPPWTVQPFIRFVPFIVYRYGSSLDVFITSNPTPTNRALFCPNYIHIITSRYYHYSYYMNKGMSVVRLTDCTAAGGQPHIV